MKHKKEISLSWCGTISEEIINAPVSFSKERLKSQPNLFAHRAALFYTPTDHLPAEYIGKGPIDICLPIPTIDFTESHELKANLCPRFWVDLIQRQLFKLRWEPFIKSSVIITRCDIYKIRTDHLAGSIKSLLDALKFKSYGGKNGKPLYYFGAIIDDSMQDIELKINQELVSHPSQAKVCIEINGL